MKKGFGSSAFKMISVRFLLLVHLIASINSQQYHCSIRHPLTERNDQNVTLLTSSKKCPMRQQCSGNNSYVFLDQNHYIKDNDQIGISFSWKPDLFSSPLCGFEITLRERQSGTLRTQYYCPNETMIFNHTNFYFECNKTALPGMLFKVTISPIPDKDYQSSVNKTFIVPSCRNKRIATSKSCRNTEIKIPENVSCRNRSFEVGYKVVVPNSRGTTAAFRVCKLLSQYCDNIPELPVKFNLLLSGKVNVSIPKSASKKDTYIIEVYPVFSTGNGLRTRVNVTDLFHACIITEVAEIKFPVLYIVVICIVVTCVFILIIIGYKTRCSISAISLLIKPEPSYQDDSNLSSNSEIMYLLFVDDHAMHRDAVLKFSAYLKFEMGFQVLFELYQREEVLKDPSSWMEKSLSRCDKVLFVWSPGATKRWNFRNEQKLVDDMFTPVLTKVAKDLSNNADRYHFVNFDYCNKVDVPEQFRNRRCNFYHLMDDFDEFYCKLKNLQVSGCFKMCCNESLYDLISSSYGSVFLESLSSMKIHTIDHPKWYEEDTLPYVKRQRLSTSDESVDIITYVENKLVIVPPSPIDDSAFLSNTSSSSKGPADEMHHKPTLKMGGKTYSYSKTRTSYPDILTISHSVSQSTNSTSNTRYTRVPVEHNAHKLYVKDVKLQLTPHPKYSFNPYSGDSLFSTSYVSEVSAVLSQRPVVGLVPVESNTDPMTSLMALNNISCTTVL